MTYTDEDYYEWVEDGARYLATIDAKININKAYDVIADIINASEEAEVKIKREATKQIAKDDAEAIAWILVNNIQQIFAIDENITPAKAIKNAFTIGILSRYYTVIQIKHATELCIPKGMRNKM